MSEAALHRATYVADLQDKARQCLPSKTSGLPTQPCLVFQVIATKTRARQVRSWRPKLLLMKGAQPHTIILLEQFWGPLCCVLVLDELWGHSPSMTWQRAEAFEGWLYPVYNELLSASARGWTQKTAVLCQVMAGVN